MNKQTADKVIVKSGPSKAYKALKPWNKDRLIRHALTLDAAHKLTINERNTIRSGWVRTQAQLEIVKHDNQQLVDDLSAANVKIGAHDAIIVQAAGVQLELYKTLSFMQDKYIKVLEEFKGG